MTILELEALEKYLSVRPVRKKGKTLYELYQKGRERIDPPFGTF
jgi:hypothetical protein